MKPRHCDQYRPEQPNTMRRLEDYARGYADRLAERRR
jgi:hypothetical protein